MTPGLAATLVWRSAPQLLGRALLHAGQLALHERFRASRERLTVLCCGRRWGKSYWLCVEAIVEALSRPYAQIRYAAPTAKEVSKIVQPLMRRLLETCPDEARPEWLAGDGIWRFGNGSEIHVAGVNEGHADRLRGVDTHLGIVDEARDVDELDYVVDDVLMPQTLSSDGRILIASTPPRTTAHPFTGIVTRAQTRGSYTHHTVYECPLNTAERIEEYQREAGGAQSDTWRREYLAEFVVDASLAVVPEFEALEPSIVIARERPPFFDAYVAIDVGFHDLTFALFALLDFRRNRLVIEDEVVTRRANSAEVARQCVEKERALWGDRQPLLRVVDAPEIVLADLSREHGYHVTAARKDDADAALNLLRLSLPRVEIHPRCVQLRAHLRHAVWNRSRTSYERSGDLGHFDGVDAAKYLVRHVDWTRNPYPVHAPGVRVDTHWIPPAGAEPRSHEGRVLARAMGRR